MSGAVEFGFALRDPAWLLLALGVAAVGAFCWRRRQGVPFAPAALAGTGGPLPRTLRQRLSWLPPALEGLALLLGVLALARPVERLPLPPERLGRDVLLCLDTSSSMAATDLAPDRSRAAIALQLAAEFARARTDDRVGFVSFARFADLGCPPTLDHEALATLLGAVRMVEHDGPEDATGIGNAVALAATVLARQPAPGKVIVLLTDGAENVAGPLAPKEIEPAQAAALCRRAGVRVHTVAIGRGDQRPDGTFVPLDTKAVQDLATSTGGRFFTAVDARALQQVYAEIDRIERIAFAEPRLLVLEWFAAPLLAALGLLLLGRGLRRSGLEVAP